MPTIALSARGRRDRKTAPTRLTIFEAQDLARATLEVGRVLDLDACRQYIRARRSNQLVGPLTLGEAAWALVIDENEVLELVMEGRLEASVDRFTSAMRIDFASLDCLIQAEVFCPDRDDCEYGHHHLAETGARKRRRRTAGSAKVIPWKSSRG